MIRTIIVDDEQHCITRLEKLIAENCSEAIHLMDSFSSADEGIKGINKLRPDLVFLDIEINDKTGFDLLKQIENIFFKVIFTTAHDKYAVQAFKFSAVEYLLKPIDADDLKQAVDKLTVKTAPNESSQKMEVLLHNMQNTSKRICVPVINGLVFLQVNEIVHCKSDVNYTTIFLKDKQNLMVAKTLKEFEELLSDYNFFRIHNSHLVNLAFIKSYNKGKGGYVTLIDGSELEVSTRRKEEFMKRLAEL